MPRGRIDEAFIEEIEIELIIKPASKATTIEWLVAKEVEKERERCTVCRQRQDWFQLDGSGRCVQCQP
jgi:hypothetical protein